MQWIIGTNIGSLHALNGPSIGLKATFCFTYKMVWIPLVFQNNLKHAVEQERCSTHCLPRRTFEEDNVLCLSHIFRQQSRIAICRKLHIDCISLSALIHPPVIHWLCELSSYIHTYGHDPSPLGRKPWVLSVTQIESRAQFNQSICSPWNPKYQVRITYHITNIHIGTWTYHGNRNVPIGCHVTSTTLATESLSAMFIFKKVFHYERYISASCPLGKFDQVLARTLSCMHE